MRTSPTLRRLVLLCTAATVGSALPASAATKGPHYHVSQHVAIPGDGGWDYLAADADDRRLYIAHNSQIDVLDLDSLKLIGAVPGISGAHGVAISHEFGHGFATSGRDSSVVMFDLKTLGVLHHFDVRGGRGPDAIAYEPASKWVYAFNGGSRNAVAFSAETGDIMNTVETEGKPEFAQTDGHGAVFFNNEDSSWVAGFDAKDKKPRVRWRLTPGETPSGLAYDADQRLLFSVCENKLVIVLDAANGKVLQSLPIGQGCDGIAFDPGTRMAFASCGDGTMTVLAEDGHRHFAVLENVPTAKGARTVAVDTKTHRVYTCTAKFGPPPAATADRPHPRPSIIPGSFEVLVLEP